MQESTLGEILHAAALNYRVTNAIAEQQKAIEHINQLGARVNDAATQRGDISIQVKNEGQDAPIYDALITLYGQRYVEGLGFTVSIQGNFVILAWADPIEFEKEVDLALNPPPVEQPIEEPVKDPETPS